MADTNEEQLLTELLSDIAQQDAGLEAPHLEARVISAYARATGSSVGPTKMRYLVIAAALLMAVLVPAMVLKTHDAPARTAAGRVDAIERTIAETRSVVAQPSLAAPRRQPIPPQPTSSAQRPLPTIRARSFSESRSTELPVTQSREEFVPLMPMTEHELRGPFQIVRVQMPRASLGTLRSPLDHPNELVEADVLLGEDGMARAIRVSTNGSIYPWRSR
jgi:hypothetical protein